MSASNISLSPDELRLVLRAMKRLRFETEHNIRKNVARGWEPQPGRLDLQTEMLKRIDELGERLSSYGESLPS
jgi:hypothetical protein